MQSEQAESRSDIRPRFTFYLDPGHGWLAVPAKLVRELGIPVSPYSYVSRDRSTLYLEEDVDAPMFLDNIIRLHGGEYEDYYTYHELGQGCFIRKLMRYVLHR